MANTMTQASLPSEEMSPTVAVAITANARTGDSLLPPRSEELSMLVIIGIFRPRRAVYVGPYSKHAADLAASEYVEFAKTASERMLNKLLEYISSSCI